MVLSTINATIQMRRGLEQDFDQDKMTAGEWAVSTDKKYVRMCFAPGVCLRMATYESFEEDMKEIQNILATCQDIQIAVDAMAKLAEQHKYESLEYANLSKSYAVGTNGEVRDGDATDNSKYYYEQAKQISQGMNGLIPMGTIAFEDLPTSDIVKNSMYNISNNFTSDDRFIDGGGKAYGAGSNVYYTSSGKWDVLAASAVTGVKGAKEDSYRQGNVNITPDNIGALATDGDSKDNTVTFTSEDVADGDATSWTSVTALKSGISHATFFQRVSQMFKNVRYLYKMLGTTDISAIGDGTVTGGLDTINSNLLDFYRVEHCEHSTGVALAAGQSIYAYIDIPTIDGFTPVMSVVSSTNNSMCFYFNVGITGSCVTVGIRSMINFDIVIKPAVDVLYIRASMT